MPTDRWKPTDLYLYQLRQAIHRISSGSGNLQEVTNEAVSGLIEQAKLPGIDTPKPYETCQSIASMLKTSLARIHACGIPSPKPFPPNYTPTSDNALYDGERLHVWTIQGVRAEESGLPMVVHVLDIGKLDYKTGKFNSDWCRCFSSKKYAGLWTFRPKNRQCWNTVYFENGKNDPSVWIKLMSREGVLPLKTYSAR